MVEARQESSVACAPNGTVDFIASTDAGARCNSRRVSYLDVKTRKRFKFLTNNFTLPALTIAQIYKSRWQVELFFESSFHRA